MPDANSFCQYGNPGRREDSFSRDIRIFGGVEDEQSATDLRGPMLDVVLGLFDGLDYDDAMC